MVILQYALAGLVGYLLGSIPFGLVVGKVRGVDVRQVGSGRTGGTNVFRAAGLGAALVTVLGDSLKGLLAVFIARYLVAQSPEAGLLAGVLAGLGAVAGHNWSVYIGFHGGAGTSPNLGALLALSPFTFVAASLAGIVALLRSRYASLGSIAVSLAAAVLLLALVLAGGQPWEYALYGVGQAGMILFALRPNIQRLRAGTERRLTWSRDER